MFPFTSFLAFGFLRLYDDHSRGGSIIYMNYWPSVNPHLIYCEGVSHLRPPVYRQRCLTIVSFAISIVLNLMTEVVHTHIRSLFRPLPRYNQLEVAHLVGK